MFDLKRDVEEYLENLRQKLYAQFSALLAKQNGKANGKTKKLWNQFKDTEIINNQYVGNLRFTTATAYIKDYLSPYGTFCDRTYFYYDPNKLFTYNKDQVVQIVMNEIFNAWSNCIGLNSSNKLSKTFQAEILGTNIALLRHIGIITENVSYATRGQNVAWPYEKFTTENRNHKYFLFPPNDKAAHYLLNKLLEGDKSLGNCFQRFETLEYMECVLDFDYLDVVPHKLTSRNHSRSTKFIKKEDKWFVGSEVLKVVKQGIEDIGIAKELIK